MALRCLHLAVFATLVLLAFPDAVAAQSKPAAFFVIGGGYGDTGNRNASESKQNQYQPWRIPFGITWPGSAKGRFSDGYISADYFADFLRVGYSPPPYASIKNYTAPKYFKRGVSFAVGGSGIFTDIGYPTYGDQVEQLAGLIRQHPDIFPPSYVQKSIVYLTYEGDDYAFQINSNNGSITTLTPDFINSVVEGIAQTVRGLYVLGLRNFVVTYAPPLGRSPLTSALNVSGDVLTSVVMQHNQALRSSLELVAVLPGIQIAVADLYKAFNYVLDYPQWFGFTNVTVPACTPTAPAATCGSVDAQGNLLYPPSPTPSSYFWWNSIHPTQAAWNAVTNLVFSGYGFTDFTPNLVIWFNLLNLTDNPSRNEGRVSRDVVQAVAAVNATGQFNLLLSVVNQSMLLPYAPQVLSETWRITTFLPTDASIVRKLGGSSLATFLQDNPQVALAVLSVHAVYGWWPAQRLLALPSGSSLQTVAGTALYFYNEPGGLFVGAPSVAGGVNVVLPDVFNSSYTGAIHGINGVIVPSYIRPLPGAM
eukprot:TRINITY_DN0_c0_g1_i3.p1 TRINITY_DN0_c0_g1~~TRINITY_DN0_c0_g1_i3.p1  ORF type:complete len:534 (+),score=30.79 TRINITY_DN0_c0_g1_i3:292-1893(+)